MSAYIFLGPEIGKKQDSVNEIKKKFKETRQQTEEYIFYADETPAAVIIDALQNQGLFSDARIVIVKNAETFKKKEDIEQLVSWTKSSHNDNSTTLILLSDETKIAAGFASAKANQQIFYEMFENEKSNWVRDFFKREGFNIDKDCIGTILELVENNTDALKRECSRLIYFLPRAAGEKSQTITAQDVEKWLSHNREESAFTLFSRIAAGDISKALESFSVMLSAKESARGVLAVLAACFRKLNDYHALCETGNENNSFELKKIGLSHPKTKNDYIAAARRYNSGAAEACLAVTAKYELLLSSSVFVMEKILMDRYILELINTGKN
ncbi:MAG: DNA polymerase III subunit delta [Treponema sp.]|nr:DNA polymerase III subunit delta [Treponema sp.]